MDVRNDRIGDDAQAKELAHRHAARSSLEQWWERLAQLSSAWDLETVKHLVVLNAAALAGAATLLAGGRLQQPKWIGAAILLGYGLGVALAILNMYLVRLSLDRNLNEVKSRMAEVYDLTKKIDRAFDPLTAGRKINIAGQTCGWLSAILAIASTLAIGISLVN
ncbi:hypothetical protein [Burkholderia seminalis]|uniref:Uncharacterized protein n=2 Tax=Burkholderia cepacia complex TaxID=87882 RepID=A0A8A8D4K7_9BURK|nr:hypothetical protein [Burkholderia seminalis]QTO19581.1 hypothetical protein DT99_004875 [Burkholderia seminalis]